MAEQIVKDIQIDLRFQFIVLATYLLLAHQHDHNTCPRKTVISEAWFRGQRGFVNIPGICRQYFGVAAGIGYSHGR